ncbi:hypothetical protein J6590_000236 [Homalodisca vitripennis]|nr:hypothetical protein J6590_000236 [Homalodisca vitripennis]
MCCQWGLRLELCWPSYVCQQRHLSGTIWELSATLRVSATSPLRNNPGVVAHRDMCCQWGLRLGADLVTCVSNVTSQEQSGSCSPSGYVLSMGTEAGVVLT